MKHLLIVQDVPTQFDMPLYNYLAEHASFKLTVIYTQVGSLGAPGIDPEIGRAPQWDHIKHELYDRIDLTRPQALRSAEVIALIASKSPDLVLVSGYYPPLHRKLVRPLKRLGLRVGLRSDNTLQHSNFRGIKGLVKKWVLPVWLRRYDSWHPVGTLAREYLEVLSRSRRPTYLFPYNVDNDWFAGQSAIYQPRREQLLAELGFSPDDFIVLGVMKWHRREDPLVLVRAFKVLLQSQPSARLILVGDGPLKDEVMEMIAEVADKVHMPGYLSYTQLPLFYALADVFVHPARSEPWGVSVNEAMACGVPTIVSNGVGAGEDLVEAGITGFVFPIGNSDALSAKLFEISSTTIGTKMKPACIEKMHGWNYEQSRAGFQIALADFR